MMAWHHVAVYAKKSHLTFGKMHVLVLEKNITVHDVYPPLPDAE